MRLSKRTQLKWKLKKRRIQDPPKAKVFWDVESNGIPRPLTPAQVVENVKKFVLSRGYVVHSINVYATLGRTSAAATLKEFDGLPGVNAVEVEKSKNKERDPCDIKMCLDMLLWAVRRKPPSPVFVIASDKDYVKTIEDLKGFGFEMIVAYVPGKSGPEIRNVTETPFEWKDLALGNLVNTNNAHMAARGVSPLVITPQLPPACPKVK